MFYVRTDSFITTTGRRQQGALKHMQQQFNANSPSGSGVSEDVNCVCEVMLLSANQRPALVNNSEGVSG